MAGRHARVEAVVQVLVDDVRAEILQRRHRLAQIRSGRVLRLAVERVRVVHVVGVVAGRDRAAVVLVAVDGRFSTLSSGTVGFSARLREAR